MKAHKTSDAWRADLTQALLDYGSKVSFLRLIPALHEEATALVNSDPFAFTLAACLDRGMKAEIVWTFPYWIRERLGHLDPHRMAEMKPHEIENLISLLPKKPRYRSAATRTIHEIAALVVREADGDARALWVGRTSVEVERLFMQVHGVGPGIASMVVMLLERSLGHTFSDMDHRTMNVKPDVHVIRVLKRLGLMRDGMNSSPMSYPQCRSQESDEADLAIEVTRQMNPEYPARLDTPLWIIGRNWCHAAAPVCGQCPVDQLCRKEDYFSA